MERQRAERLRLGLEWIDLIIRIRMDGKLVFTSLWRLNDHARSYRRPGSIFVSKVLHGQEESRGRCCLSNGKHVEKRMMLMAGLKFSSHLTYRNAHTESKRQVAKLLSKLLRSIISMERSAHERYRVFTLIIMYSIVNFGLGGIWKGNPTGTYSLTVPWCFHKYSLQIKFLSIFVSRLKISTHRSRTWVISVALENNF